LRSPVYEPVIAPHRAFVDTIAGGKSRRSAERIGCRPKFRAVFEKFGGVRETKVVSDRSLRVACEAFVVK
jgi:hypothetical protein